MICEFVLEPEVFSESDTHCYLWGELRRLGYNVRSEVKVKTSQGKSVRFDLVIFKNNLAEHIIEVKGDRRKNVSNWENTKQGSTYKKFGIPVTLICGMANAEKFVQKLQTKQKTLC